MKRILFFIFLVVQGLLISGQNNNFKAKLKNPPGTNTPGFSFKKIHSINGSKTVLTNKFIISQALPLQPFNVDKKYLSKVIRKNGVPIYIEKKTNPKKSAGNTTFEQRFYSFLDETREISGTTNPGELFKITHILTDNLGITQIRAIQRYKGIDIYGSESTLHMMQGRKDSRDIFVP